MFAGGGKKGEKIGSEFGKMKTFFGGFVLTHRLWRRPQAGEYWRMHRTLMMMLLLLLPSSFLRVLSPESAARLLSPASRMRRRIPR